MSFTNSNLYVSSSAAIKNSAHVVQGSIYTSHQYHFHMETQVRNSLSVAKSLQTFATVPDDSVYLQVHIKYYFHITDCIPRMASKKLVELVVGPRPYFLIFSWGPSIFVPHRKVVSQVFFNFCILLDRQRCVFLKMMA